MLHIREFYKTRQDGVCLYRTYSDEYMIQKVGTEEVYSEAIDVEASADEYFETDIPLAPDEQEEATFTDAMDALGRLGVDFVD